MPRSSSCHLDVDIDQGLPLSLGEMPDPRSHSLQDLALYGANPIERLLQVSSVVNDLITGCEVAEVLGEPANRRLADRTHLLEDLASEASRIEV